MRYRCQMLLFSRSVMSDSSATPWTIAFQAPLSLEFTRQEYWSGLPCPPSGNLPTQGLNLHLLIAGRFFTCLVLMSDILLLGTVRTVTTQVVSSGTGWHFTPKCAHNIGHKEKGHSTYSERSLLRSDF